MMSVVVVIAVATLSLFAVPASGQVYYIPFKIPDHPSVNNVELGTDFGVDGTRFYVSGRGSFTGDTSPGGVYQFDRNTYQYIQTYAPVVEPWNDWFGYTMEYYEGAILVSAILADNSAGDQRGEVYMINAGNGSLVHTFEESANSGVVGRFGADLSYDDVNIFIGAPGYDPNGAGKVFVYDSANNLLVATLAPDPLTTDIRFGSSVDHNSSYIAVAAPGYDLDNIEGAVYVYDYNTKGLLYRLTSPIPDLDGTAGFGYEIELEGDLLLVSVFEFGALNIRGKVFVYDLATGDLVHTLTPDNGDIFSRFGYSMSVEGNIAVISAERDNDVVIHGGAVYIYDLNTFELIDKVHPPLLNRAFMMFGQTVKIQDGVIMASAVDPRIPDIQTNEDVVYVLEQFCRADINLDGSIDFFDISDFLKYAIDFNKDGAFDFFDIAAFLAAIAEGCP